MTLRLTVETMRAAYEYLRTTPPFRRWKMPAATEIKFKITRNENERGKHVYTAEDGKHEIHVSEGCIGRTESLMHTMGHEMIHLHQAHAKTPGRKSHHGAEWKRMAKLVCKHHGFDEKLF